MTTSYITRSARFTLLLLLVIGSLVTGCKKGSTDADVDPRDQIVGTYSGGFRVTISIGSIAFDPETGTSVTTITKGSSAKQILVQNVYANGAYTEKVTAELQSDGNSYQVIDKNTDQITANGKKFDSDYVATTVFAASQGTFAYTATSRSLQSGTEVKRTIEVTGSKK